MLVHVQLDGIEEALPLAEFEARVRDGRIGPETPVREERLTQGRWAAARTVAIWQSIAESPEARFQQSWSRGVVPWMTALVCGACLRVFAWSWGTQGGVNLGEAWARSTPAIVELGQPWRLFTYGLLHAGPAHVLMNVLFLAFIGVALETLLGPEAVAALFLFAVVCGGTLSAFLSPDIASVGASAGDFGFLVAAVVIGWRYLDLLPRAARSAFGASILWFSAWGFFNGLRSEGVDNWGHFGGIVAGVAFGALARPVAAPGGLRRNRWLSAAVVAGVTLWLVGVGVAGPRLLPFQADAVDGVALARPAWWKTGVSANQDPGWTSAIGAGAVSARSLHRDRPAGLDAAVAEVVASFQTGEEGVTVGERAPVARDGVTGERVALRWTREGVEWEALVEVYARGRYVQTVEVEAGDPALFAVLVDRVFPAVHLTTPEAVGEKVAAAGSGPRGTLARAQAAAELGDLEGAIILYRQAMAEAPADGRIREAWVRELADWQRPEAADEARAAVAALPEDRSLRAAAALSLHELGHSEEALALLDAGLAVAPGDRLLTRARRRISP